MAPLKFIYKEEKYIDGVSKKWKSIHRPIIPIRLGYNRRVAHYIVPCLLDSGADRNLFPAAWGQSIGVKLKKGVPTVHIGIGGSSEIAYRHKVKLFLGTHQIITDADFSETHTLPLLGREAFFSFFDTITFDQKNMIVTLSF